METIQLFPKIPDLKMIIIIYEGGKSGYEGGNFMDKRYVIRTDAFISEPMSREEAIQQVKKYDQQGVSAYIVSEEESKRIKPGEFRTPKWS